VLAMKPGGGGVKFLELTLPAEPASVPRARHAVTQFAEGCHADPLNVGTAVTEAVTNAVIHAYRDDAPRGDIHVKASLRNGALIVVVEDEGVGMKPHLDSPGLGMGAALIASMTEAVTYDCPGKGVRVTMNFPCREPAMA
jgi:anti-sigma regulatory factor (Ser/Thr protein kinase)